MARLSARRIGWMSHSSERVGDDLMCLSPRRYRMLGDDHIEEIA